jgi:hypothetical protein
MAQGGALEGTPIQEIVSMRPQAAPGTPEAAPGSSVTSAPAPSQPAPTQNNSQQSPSAAIAGALSGRFGGLGGFGRKKQSQSSQDAAPAAPATSSGDGTLIEMTMENSAFSAAPVNSALFEIPAGFREVPPDMPRTSKERRVRNHTAPLGAALLTYPFRCWPFVCTLRFVPVWRQCSGLSSATAFSCS